jgi:hypothetical protein
MLLNFLPASFLAQEDLEVQIDSSRIEVKQFKEDLSQKYTGSEFDYDTSLEGESQNFIARALYWILNKISETFGLDLDPETYQTVEFLFYAILIVLALYIIIRLLVGQKAAAFFSKTGSKLAPLNIQEEHIESVDLDQFIKDALAQKDFRLALRYMYLKVLKDLSLRNVISWHFDKTNRDYYQEIENPQLKDSFKKVSYLYDYVWYGEFELDEGGFANAQLDFERLTKNLNHAG